MKIKELFFPIICALLIGFIMGKFMFEQYNISDLSIPTIKTTSGTKATFLQIGSYNSKEDMEKSLTGIEQYIYMVEESKYIAYVAITTDTKNISKLQGYYQEKGYITYVKELNISSDEFINQLYQYDQLLNKTEEIEAIGVVVNNVLKSYKELVISKQP